MRTDESCCWEPLLKSVDRSRDISARYFKPACLLAVCSLIDRGAKPGLGIPAETVVQEFDRLVRPLYPKKAGSGWMPLWHLMRDGAWVCVRGNSATLRTAFAQGKPRSRKQLSTWVDAIKLPDHLLQHWEDETARNELKRRICLMLSEDQDQQAIVAGHYFANLFGLPTLHETEHDSSRSKLSEDLAEIKSDENLRPRTRQQLIDARLGQGQFRQELERIFDARCAVTGLQQRQVLRASHILAWRESTDYQRLDPNNGLLLSANLDALFDRHLITFDRHGRVRVSGAMDAEELPLLGPVRDLLREPTRAQWGYLRLHNAAFDALNAIYLQPSDSHRAEGHIEFQNFRGSQSAVEPGDTATR